ncbi:hypothetical protein CC80DRAFT_555127 [Byssothecium circinans]|uniref:F-box domain-containing protein n=1 Tax=Byssothecium circinans TaxID=147558 RepID=A0A6A5TFU4_9PLEO|nr:hypothetical protein CC80DRAFT_555127 [Byssothecium circinans]
MDIQRNDHPLPKYLARHISLGFSSEDIDTFISAVEASQRAEASSLPYLPSEIQFMILDHVPIDYILPWRMVCHGYHDYIDGPLLYQYLTRAQLVGYLGSRTEPSLGRLPSKDYDSFRFLRANFERVEEPPEFTIGAAFPKWRSEQAIFRVKTSWMRRCKHFDERLKASQSSRASWETVLERLELLRDEACHGTLRWCIRLDTAVHELEFPVEALRNSFGVDLSSGRILVQWKNLLFRFLKTETQLRKLLEDKKESVFTYGYREDCLRAVRRQRLRAALNMDDPAHRRISWEMSLMRPLFGKPQYDIPAGKFADLRVAEDNALVVLTFLRKEAAMSKKELAHLQQLASDREHMERELKRIDQDFAKWKCSLFGVPLGSFADKMPELPLNPLNWSDSQRAAEEARVNKWKAQRKMLIQLSQLLGESVETMSVPEDAFDDLGSDI